MLDREPLVAEFVDGGLGLEVGGELD